MTTENDGMVELPDRDISVLLSLDTYQGMTDSEIQSIIDWNMRLAYDSALSSAQIGIWNDAAQTMIDGNESHMQSLESMVQSILNRNTALGVVEGV